MANHARTLLIRGSIHTGHLDHNAVSSGTATVLGLVGKDGEEPEVRLSELESKALGGRQALVTYLKGVTKRTPAALATLLDGEPDAQRVLALRPACGGNQTLVDRVLPFLGVLRDDLRSIPMVFPPGAIYVTQTGSRRDTGTAYTTRHLAEELAEHALAPLCYQPGPQDTPDRDEWRVRSADEILNLKVCDPAVGSGAILVAACRYLADALIEAWISEGQLDVADLASASDDPSRNVYRIRALRVVAERCCYGVDRNPMAVEMTKMSFWLTTMARDRPFSYLDHNLRSGDSLLGITDLDQLRTLHLAPTYGRARSIGLPGIDVAEAWAAINPLVDEAIGLRLDIETSPSDTARDTAHKAVLSIRANTKMEIALAISDLLVGSAIVTAAERDARRALDDALIRNVKFVSELLAASGTPGEPHALAALQETAQAFLDRGRPTGAGNRRPLHWPLSFPEVFTDGRRGFDTVVGNPPFAGGRKISGAMGSEFREFLVQWVAGGVTGSADLIAFFFLLSTQIGNSFGLLATNTIAQGDTSEVGLTQIVDRGWTIYRAVDSMTWPGTSTLEVAKVWATLSTWDADVLLNGRPVAGIDEMLYRRSRSGWRKRRLAANAGQSFQGSIVLGKGFTPSDEEASALMGDNADAADVLRPYLGGDVANESPTHTARRWAINFYDWDEYAARRYAGCFSYVEEHARSEVDAKGASYEGWSERWWQLWRPRADLYRKIAPLERVMVLTQTSKLQLPMFVPSRQTFSHKLVIFPYDDSFHFGLISSMFHWRWVLRFGSTLRTDPVYTPSDVFDTFPQPPSTESIATAAEALDEFRADLMDRTGKGLTDTYNRFHDPETKGEAIERLRDLHLELDYAVRDAYSWGGVLPDLKHGFHHVRLQGDRFTFAPDVADEVIDLLLEENKRRYDAEVAVGLHDRGLSRSRDVGGQRLFDDDEESDEDDEESDDEEQE